MNVDLYEKFWLWASVGIIVVFVASVLYTSAAQSLQPPSHVETIDPRAVSQSPGFVQPQVTLNADGSATVHVIARMFGFSPAEIRVPRGRPVTFRITSTDVTHGFQIVKTNGNSMVIPGYVSQFTTRFDTAGEYLIVCNEYCGLGHHVMFAKLIVEEAPTTALAPRDRPAAAADGAAEVAP